MTSMKTSTTAATETLVTTIESPVGQLTLEARDGCLVGLHLEEQRHPFVPPPGTREDDTGFDEVRAQLDEYFTGERTTFDVPLRLEGTEFQRRVWEALCAIPYGETIDYGELAGRVGNPRASRAVGQANGRNPVAIIVPCHRVIAADGTLGGYGGGLDCKTALLDLEAAHRP
jgi:methylated-DNA-[protein]-cysteine S-methyltransferase